VCGYPVGGGGELYGGSMFIKSAAMDTLQGRAIQSVNERWSEQGNQQCWNGRETIGIAVCKKKYAPFRFTVNTDPIDGKRVVQVERMFGCKCHSDIRRDKIEIHGVRERWEPFGQWSMGKAQELARRETERMNQNRTVALVNGKLIGFSLAPSSFCEEISSDEDFRSICNKGKCTWKMKAKYDNIFREITGGDASDGES
jgi:hypothetical protein